MNQKRLKTAKGFTLLELLMVLLIIGLLAALVGPSLYQRVQPAKAKVAAVQISTFVQALDSFYIDNDDYPSTAQGLNALRVAPSGMSQWNGPYLKKDVPADPWGGDYIYRSPGRNGGFEIMSLGKDGVKGGDGENADIVSW